jgi:hypothetical protein
MAAPIAAGGGSKFVSGNRNKVIFQIGPTNCTYYTDVDLEHIPDWTEIARDEAREEYFRSERLKQTQEYSPIEEVRIQQKKDRLADLIIDNIINCSL